MSLAPAERQGWGANRVSRVEGLLIGLASVVIILYVPYFIPQAPVASDSYVFGYNNRAGVVLLRFMPPLYFVLMVYRVSRRGSRAEDRHWTAVLAVGLTAILLLISPEMAVAHCFACCVLLFPRRTGLSGGALPLGVYAGMLAGMAALFGAALRLHLLETLVASGGGADSFPIVLSISVVFFLRWCLWVRVHWSSAGGHRRSTITRCA